MHVIPGLSVVKIITNRRAALGNSAQWHIFAALHGVFHLSRRQQSFVLVEKGTDGTPRNGGTASPDVFNIDTTARGSIARQRLRKHEGHPTQRGADYRHLEARGSRAGWS